MRPEMRPMSAVRRLTATYPTHALLDRLVFDIADVVTRPGGIVSTEASPVDVAAARLAAAGGTRATQLDLGSAGLSNAPEWLGQLSNITTLNLRGNQLTALPDALGQLTNLITLDLTG